MAESHLRNVEERGIHRLTMDYGPNALDLGFIREIRSVVGLLRESGAPPFVLVSSHPTLFCPGWNLKHLVSADRSDVTEVLRAFNHLILDLFSYPGPTAAAISGHAVAAGCELALACDLRIMVSGQPRLGLSELNLGLPVPAGSLLMLRSRLSPSVVEKVVLHGDGLDADRARELGMVQRTVLADDLFSTVDRELRKLASKPNRAFRATKVSLFGDCWQRMQQSAAAAEPAFLDCWFDVETRGRIARVAQRLGEQ